MMLLSVSSPAAQKTLHFRAMRRREGDWFHMITCSGSCGPEDQQQLRLAFITEIRLLLCAVLSRGAGCVDPGADEEGRELVQPVGTETAG